eukprot:s573_g12.t1
MFGHWLSEPCEQVQRGEGLNDGMAKTLHVLRMVMCAHMATARPAQTQPVPRSSACILLEIFGQCQPYAECSNVQQILNMLLARIKSVIAYALQYEAPKGRIAACSDCKRKVQQDTVEYPHHAETFATGIRRLQRGHRLGSEQVAFSMDSIAACSCAGPVPQMQAGRAKQNKLLLNVAVFAVEESIRQTCWGIWDDTCLRGRRLRVEVGFRRNVTIEPKKSEPLSLEIETRSLQPLVLEISSFLSDADCQHVIDKALPHVEKSAVKHMDHEAWRHDLVPLLAPHSISFVLSAEHRTSKWIAAEDVGKPDANWRTSSTYFMRSDDARRKQRTRAQPCRLDSSSWVHQLWLQREFKQPSKGP